MNWFPALLVTLAAGWCLARASAGLLFRRTNPVVGAAGELGLAVLFGPGFASVLFFVLTLAGFPGGAAVLGTLAALAVVSGAAWWTTRSAEFEVPASVPSAFPWTWILLLGFAAALLEVGLNFSTTTSANPNGDWDASAIWNLRARFLASGPTLWQRAIAADPGSFMMRGSHPSYPLFLSSFLAMLWSAAGSFPIAVPVVTSGLIAFAVVALLTASLAARRSLALGLLAGMILLVTEAFASQASAQYADLLVALAMVASLVLLDAAAAESPAAPVRLLIAAGVAIGFAPWIKNEGVPFTVAALAVAAWRFRLRDWIWILAGSAPGLLATGLLKSMAQGHELMFPATVREMLTKLAEPGRWVQSAGGLGGAVLEFGPWWAHPVLLMIVLIGVLRFRPSTEWRSRAWLAVPIILVIATEFGLFLVTRLDLAWQVGTAASRLVLQLWPAVIWLVFSMLRTPEEYFPQVVVPAAAAAPAPAPRRKRSKD